MIARIQRFRYYVTMKKIIAALALLCVFVVGAFGQTMLDLSAYEAALFDDVDESVRPIRRVQLRNNRDIFEKIQILDGNVEKYTPLERALQGYYVYDAETCPSAAEAILPHSNPKLADQKLGAAVFQEIQILRFLGNTEAVNRHEAVLQFITGRGNATRAEIEAFYRNNVRALVSQVVDEEFTGVTVPAVTVTYVKDSLTNFLTTPNQTNFNTLRGIYHSTDGNLEYIQQSYNADMANLATAESIGANNLIESYRSSARNAQNILNTRRRQLNAPNDTPIDWNGFRSAYRTILNGLNTELVRRM